MPNIFFVVIVSVSTQLTIGSNIQLMHNHYLTNEMFSELSRCNSDPAYCEDNYHNLTTMFAKIANDHAYLLLHDIAQSIFMEAFFTISPYSRLGKKISHIRSSLAFSQGDVAEVLTIGVDFFGCYSNFQILFLLFILYFIIYFTVITCRPRSNGISYRNILKIYY